MNGRIPWDNAFLGINLQSTILYQILCYFLPDIQLGHLFLFNTT